MIVFKFLPAHNPKGLFIVFDISGFLRLVATSLIPCIKAKIGPRITKSQPLNSLAKH